MSTTWMVKTNGDPLAAIRQVLLDVWKSCRLDGMLLPRYQSASGGVAPFMAVHPEEIQRADPCAPLQIRNAAPRLLEIAAELPTGNYAAVLRPCEGRVIDKKNARTRLNLEGWFFIGIDCLASFPKEDFVWRLKQAGGVDSLTREVIQFARQGGIVPYRYRRACQECPEPEWDGANLSIEILGLPVKEYLLVSAHDDAAAACLDQIAERPALPALIDARQRILEKIKERRLAARQRRVLNLEAGLPETVEELIAWLENCAPCRECLEACPVYADELASGASRAAAREAAVRHWLSGCVACGMCEEACLRGFPMTAIIHRLEAHLVPA